MGWPGSERLTAPSLKTAALVVVLLLVLAVQLSLFGVTDFPFRSGDDRQRDAALGRVLAGAENQCRFGNALVSAGGPTKVNGRKRIRPHNFAESYARSFSGISKGERERIEQACLEGFRSSHRRR